jgi:hypothetical protein
VSENLASTSLADGEIMFAHLVPIEGTTMLEAISPLSFRPMRKDGCYSSRQTKWGATVCVRLSGRCILCWLG